MTKLANAVVLLGILTILAAVGWWLYYYGGIADDTMADLQDVFQCLYSTEGRCAVVRSLSKIGGGTPYQPMVLWVGSGILAVGILLRLTFASKN